MLNQKRACIRARPGHKSDELAKLNPGNQLDQAGSIDLGDQPSDLAVSIDLGDRPNDLAHPGWLDRPGRPAE